MDSRKVDLDEALLVLNGWLGQPVRLLVLIQLGASSELPPVLPAQGWHVVLGRVARLGLPDPRADMGPDPSPREEDWVRQQTVGTYELGDGTTKLLLDGLPCERILHLEKEDQPPYGLAFYLPGSVVLLLEPLPE